HGAPRAVPLGYRDDLTTIGWLRHALQSEHQERLALPRRGDYEAAMSFDELCIGSLIDAAALIKTGGVSPVELTRAMLERFERLDGRLYSYLTVPPEQALSAARTAEAEILRGELRGAGA